VLVHSVNTPASRTITLLSGICSRVLRADVSNLRGDGPSRNIALTTIPGTQLTPEERVLSSVMWKLQKLPDGVGLHPSLLACVIRRCLNVLKPIRISSSASVFYPSALICSFFNSFFFFFFLFGLLLGLCIFHYVRNVPRDFTFWTFCFYEDRLLIPRISILIFNREERERERETVLRTTRSARRRFISCASPNLLAGIRHAARISRFSSVAWCLTTIASPL